MHVTTVRPPRTAGSTCDQQPHFSRPILSPPSSLSPVSGLAGNVYHFFGWFSFFK